MAMLVVGVATPALAAEADPVRLDVGLAAGADPATVVAGLGDGVRFEPVEGLDAIAVDVPADRVEAALATLGGDAGVRYAQRGGVVQGDAEITNSALNLSEVPQAWTWTTGSPDITVAVVDSGVTPNADLPADRLTAGYDFIDGDTDTTDDSGHGTLVANVVGADRDNNAGASGVCDQCRIMPVRVLTGPLASSATGTTADTAAGIVWAADHGAQIINVSLSTADASLLLKEAVEHAAGKGALVVASAGNAYTTEHRFPAAYEPAFAVGRYAVGPRNTESDRWVDVSGVGGMTVLDRTGQLRPLPGASASTAVVSGVAALALAMKPSASAGEVRDAIQRDAELRGTQTRYDPPVVNAAKVIYGFGGTDTVKPVVSATGFTENEPVAATGEQATPTVSDDHGIERVEYRFGDRVLATANWDNWWTNLKPPAGHNGPMPITVRAYDYAGNFGELTTVVQADTAPPTATFVSPVSNGVVPGGPGAVDVVLSSPDSDIEIIYSPYLNGTTFSWDAAAKVWRGKAGYTDGGFDDYRQIGVHIQDKAGNLSQLFQQVRVDSDPPAGGTITPSYGQRFRGNFTSTLSGVTDVGGVAKAELWANGKYMGVDTTAPYALTVRPATYSGNVMLTWRVTDRFGLWRNVPNRLVVADNRVPTVSITKAPKNKAKVRGTVKVYVKASDASGISRVELVVNGKVVSRDYKAGYVLSVNTKKQKTTMKVQVRAYDRVGNVKYTTTRTWRR
ncbi:S8 family serine peptidase [Actinoplanes sp. NPDC051861]|uniref:S8 family serine peptidase n=1 Tax=Actinoplanes sp. NPDC051861 TaxID=3155170 RepID=UPI003427E0A4